MEVVMKKKFIFILRVLVGFFFIAWAPNAIASGIGPYLEYASGNGSYNDFGIRSVDGESPDVDVVGFGITIDTNLSEPTTFNYRIAFGFNKLDSPSGYDGWGLSMDNTFGFKVLHEQNCRIWLGPQIHLSGGKVEVPYFNWGEYFGFNNDDYVFIPSDYDFDYYDDQYSDLWSMGEVQAFRVGIGMVAGANFNVSDSGAFCFEFGARYQNNYLKDIGKDYTFRNGDLVGVYVDDMNYSYHETVFFLRFSFLFAN